MNVTEESKLAAWTTEAGLVGKSEIDMLTGFCERAAAAGVPLAGALVIIDTLHPIYEGHAVRWARGAETTVTAYGRTHEGIAAENWRRSTYYRLVETGAPMLRVRLDANTPAEFPGLARDVEEGKTEFVAFRNRFAAEAVIGEMDCIYSGWVTDAAEGFDDADVAALQRLTPFLALAMKSASLARISDTLVQTYLGRDAGRMVLGGRIQRGVAEKINAVLWFSDLQGFTRITDTSAPEEILPLLNDYAEVVITAIQEMGGDVLKLIGDGVLAIFRADDAKHACHSALKAAGAAAQTIARLNERRAAEAMPTTRMYLGLHFGEAFLGNIGSPDRLDFTVVGPAVNLASRIAAMCRSVDRPLLASASFAKAHGEVGTQLVSVGRYALRGVGRAEELFTLDPESAALAELQ
jgi:adenylate cyclase